MKLVLAIAAVLIVGVPASAQDAPFENAFKNASERTRAVLYAALGEAKQRGAAYVDVDDLIVALVAEDQDPRATMLFDDTPLEELFSPGARTWTERTGRNPFFPPKVAVDVLIKLNSIPSRVDSVATTTGIPISAALDRVLTVASKLPAELHQGEVEITGGTDTHPPGMYQAVVPLDLLAAALWEPCEGTRILQAAGITVEKVLRILRTKGVDLENGSFHIELSSVQQPNGAAAMIP